MSKYDLIVADPPWSFKSSTSSKHRGSARGHYSTMTLADVRELKVRDIANDNSICYMWCPFSQYPMGVDVLESWGFLYKTAAFVWIKLTKDGRPKMGMGSYTRSEAEVCIVGTRGKGVPRIDKGVRQVIQTVPGKHSVKPVEAMDRIDRLHGGRASKVAGLYGGGISKIDLFARTLRNGWDAWGDETIPDFASGPAGWKVKEMWNSKLLVQVNPSGVPNKYSGWLYGRGKQ